MQTTSNFAQQVSQALQFGHFGRKGCHHIVAHPSGAKVAKTSSKEPLQKTCRHIHSQCFEVSQSTDPRRQLRNSVGMNVALQTAAKPVRICPREERSKSVHSIGAHRKLRRSSRPISDGIDLTRFPPTSLFVEQTLVRQPAALSSGQKAAATMPTLRQDWLHSQCGAGSPTSR